MRYGEIFHEPLNLQKSSFLKTLASKLLEVAEKYHLITICETELGEASVIGTLILADLHGRVCSKKACLEHCLEYICLNSARVFETSEWADFRDHKNQYAQLYLNTLSSFHAALIEMTFAAASIPSQDYTCIAGVYFKSTNFAIICGNRSNS